MKQPINVQARTVEAQPPALNLGDLYYIFFRHKWMILVIFLAGIAGAAGFYLTKPPVYESEAKILIRYILENKGATPAPGTPSGSLVMSPDSRGENIVNSEIQILTSLDLAGQVADLIGPEKILAKMGGGNDRNRAAAVIRNGLIVDVPQHSNILRILFRHPDPSMTQPILSQLVDSYFKRHVEIHQGVGALDDFFSRQADQLRSRLSQTEDDLKKLRTDTQILSLEENKHTVMAERERIEQDLFSAEAELAEQTTALNALQKLFPTQPSLVQTTTNTLVPSEVVDRYRALGVQLNDLKKQRSELQFHFTDEHPAVKRLNEQITLVESEKRRLTEEHPTAASMAPVPQAVANGGKSETDPATQYLRVSSLEAKIKVLTNQLEQVRSTANRVIEAEPAITQLQRKRDVDEASYRYYVSSLEQARVDESVGAGKITNIGVVQTPSPPARDIRALLKPVGGILAFGLFGGLALALLIEKFLDQTLKRVSDIERLVRLPVFVSVPDLVWQNGHARFSKLSRNGHSSSNGHSSKAAGTTATNGNGNASAMVENQAEVAPWDAQHKLRSYFEGLRDRLITYFEVRDLTHKPKLVAVTSCNRGAGVTTMAAGLAATLSETGDGNVLLVDMNLDRGVAHPFHQGKPGCALSEALENATRDPAQVQDNLYLVTAYETKNDKLPRVLPKRFAHLIPRMKSSDYDYIIFDMPPITQTSVTPRLAGFMDMVIVVIESGTTGQEIVKRANGLLNESRANVAVVLNKHRAYVPARFNQEL